MHSDEFSWRETPEELNESWAALIDTAGLNPSLYRNWLDAIARGMHLDGDLRVFRVMRDEKLLGIIPFFARPARMWGIPVVVVELAGNLAAYHQEIIAAGDHPAILEAFLQHLSGTPWHVLKIANIDEAGPTCVALHGFCRAHPEHVLLEYPGETSPLLPITETWDQFLASKRKKFRYKLRRYSRELHKAGKVSMRWANTAADTDLLLKDLLQIEARSWKANADMAISHRPHERRYYEFLVPYLATSEMLMANVLSFNDEPIAYSLCYVHGNRAGQMKTSYDERFAAMSPGTIVMEESIKKAFDDGMSEFDFLGDIMPHKMEWARKVRRHRDFFLFSPAIRARVLGWSKRTLQRLRPPAPPTA